MAKPPLLWLRSQQPVVAVVADVAAYRRLLTVGITLQRLRKVTAAVTACARAFDRFSRRLLFFTASICKQTEPKTRAQTGSGVFGCKVNGIAFFSLVRVYILKVWQQMPIQHTKKEDA